MAYIIFGNAGLSDLFRSLRPPAATNPSLAEPCLSTTSENSPGTTVFREIFEQVLFSYNLKSQHSNKNKTYLKIPYSSKFSWYDIFVNFVINPVFTKTLFHRNLYVRDVFTCTVSNNFS